MKNFKQLIKELPSNKVVIAFGAFQPPTSMHEHLVKSVKRVADGSADYAIYTSANEDKKYNPLPVDRKVYFLNRMFPGTKFQETKEETIVGLAKKLNEKYKNLVVVVGEDKVAETEKQLTKANGKEFTFESIKVVSTGSTDPDSDLSSGVSGLRMCESAKAGKFEDFKKGLPHTLTEHDSRRLMNEVRKGLGQDPIKEVVEFTRSSVREQYIAGEIFNVGDKVQDDKGVYEIMDRGANYITVVNESGELSKKWIDKVTAVETIDEDIPGGYAPEEITFKGYTTKNLHHSKDAAMAFQQTINKYNSHIIKDGVAILNALKATDTYMKLNDMHLDQMKPPILSEVKEWVSAHMKAKESLERIGEFLHHMDYWDSHGHELQMLMTNYASAGAGDMADCYTPEGTMIPENADETKKIMMRYKDFLKKSASSEPPIELGAESAAKKVDTKEPEDTKKVTQSDQGSDVKIETKDPKHTATGFSMTKPFDINDNLRRQKVKYALGESRGLADKHWNIAQDHKEAARVVKGDAEKYHSHMADHHEAMSRYHEELGQTSHAESHADKAEIHHAKAMAAAKVVKEDVYTSDTKKKDYQTKDKDGNWVWRSRKIHPKRITFDASKMGAAPAQPLNMDEATALEKFRLAAAEREKKHKEEEEKRSKLPPEQRMSSAIDALEKKLNKEEAGLEESWIVHKDGKLIKKFVTHSAAKSHAEKHGAKVNSSEYYYDNIHKKLGEETEENNTKKEHDLGYSHASQGKKSNPYNPGSASHKAYEAGQEAHKRHFGESSDSHELGIDHDEPISRREHIMNTIKKHGGKITGQSDKSTYVKFDADKVHAAKKELKAGGVRADHWINGDLHEDKDPCWTGYKQLGVKKKNGKTVPNCIPVKEETKTYGSWILKQKSMLSKKTEGKDKKKVTKAKSEIADNQAFDSKNAGGTPAFDPFFSK